MFFLVMIILLSITAIIGIIVAFNGSRDGGLITLGASVGVFILVLALNVFTTVQPGFVKVAKLFGKPVTEYTSGFSWVNPFYDMEKYDGRIQEYTRSGRADEGAKEGYDAINATTKNNMEIYIEETIKWQIAPGQFTNILQEVGDFDAVVDKFVRPDISDVTNMSVSKFDGNNIIKNRDSLKTMINITLKDKWDKDGFVKLISTNVRDIDLPDDFKTAVIEKLASREKITTAQNLAEAKGFEGEAVLNYQKKIAEAKQLGKTAQDNALEWKRLDILEKLANNKNINWGIVQMNENGTPLFINQK